MRYRNKLTGYTLDTDAVISGNGWEKVETSSPSVSAEVERPTAKKTAKKTPKKKSKE